MSFEKPLRSLLVPHGTNQVDRKEFYEADAVFLFANQQEGVASTTVQKIVELLSATDKLVFTIADSEHPELDTEAARLSGIQDERICTLTNGCRGNIRRIMGALECLSPKKLSLPDIRKNLVRLFAASDTDTLIPSLAAYDVRSQAFQNTEKYHQDVAQLREILSVVKDLKIGVDLEGVLVGSYYPDLNDSLQQYSSYILHTFAHAFLKILSKHNEVYLCTDATTPLVQSIRTQTGLILPQGKKIFSRRDLVEFVDTDGKMHRAKVPHTLGLDKIIDDLAGHHYRRACRGGFSVERDSYIDVPQFNYNTLRIVPCRHMGLHDASIALASSVAD